MEQGQEEKIIFISTVLTKPESLKRAQAGGGPEQNVGFLSNAKRFNVAITRAKVAGLHVQNFPLDNYEFVASICHIFWLHLLSRMCRVGNGEVFLLFPEFDENPVCRNRVSNLEQINFIFTKTNCRSSGKQ